MRRYSIARWWGTVFLMWSSLLWGEALPELYPPPPLCPLTAEAICLECKGSGKRAVADKGLRSATTGKVTFLVTCQFCHGAGHYVRNLLPNERLERQRQARQTYDRVQLAAGRIPLAAAYMDREAATALAPEAYARLAMRYPRTCIACWGLGSEPCRKCKGTGKIVERKRAVVSSRNESSRNNVDEEPQEEVVVCPSCHGSAVQKCRKCAGDGLAPCCKKCKGTGVMMKKAKRDLPAHLERCSSCEGEGRK
ncbi:MAG: hypothetical protein RR268_03070 [Kiritimatiellia bacterium]